MRILPGTCVTFVVYEQVSRLLERLGEKKRVAKERSSGEISEDIG